MKRKYIILIAVATIVIIFDVITKLAILDRFRLGETYPIINGFFDLTYIRNKGAAFGFLRGLDDAYRIPFFLMMPVLALVFVGAVFRKLPAQSILVATALSLVVGGAIGNLIDRVRWGSVVDFLLFHWKYKWQYPAFNVADSAITVGVALLIWDLFTNKEQYGDPPPKKKKKAKA